MKKIDVIQAFSLFFLTTLTYIFTIHPLTREYSFSLLVVAFSFFVSFLIFNKKSHPLFIYFVLLVVLLIVGITGWFNSPLFSWLYIMAIALAFVFRPLIANIFILILVAIFIPYLESFNLSFELLTIVSLFFLIPISEYLRKKYLDLKENEKRIIVLKQENEIFENKLKELLSNKITKEAVDLREPLNDIKQLSTYYQNKLKKITKEDMAKITKISQKAMEILNKFEEQATGLKLLKNPKK